MSHLDLLLTEAVQQVLPDYPGVLLLTSHDQPSTDTAVDRLLSIEGKRTRASGGNLSDYQRQA